MKKVTVIFLSLLILFNSSGYIILFTHFKSELRDEIRKESFAEKHRHELVCFKIRKADIYSYDSEIFFLGEDEFEAGGKMYDVVKREETKDYFILYCVNDSREEKFLTELDRQLDNSSASSANTVPFTKVLVKKPVLLTTGEKPLDLKAYFTISYTATKPEKKYNPAIIKIPSPPPRYS